LAKHEIVTLLDDLAKARGEEDTQADETVWFSLDGTDYEIDLTFSNAAGLRKLMAPYTEAGRRQVTPRRAKGHRTAAQRNRSADIRSWAKNAGREVPDRGRIPVAIVAEYDAQH
jgi:hypothetical protein